MCFIRPGQVSRSETWSLWHGIIGGSTRRERSLFYINRSYKIRALSINGDINILHVRFKLQFGWLKCYYSVNLTKLIHLIGLCYLNDLDLCTHEWKSLHATLLFLILWFVSLDFPVKFFNEEASTTVLKHFNIVDIKGKCDEYCGDIHI